MTDAKTLPAPAAWMNQAGDVINGAKKHAWQNYFGDGGKRKAEAYSTPLYAADLAAARSGGGKPVATFSEPVVLPDGSAFATASLPLPADHWLYAPRSEWDSARDDFAETPLPILTNARRDAVRAAGRYAVRAATMCGKEMDFDPDALVQNLCYALCGPATGSVLSADAHGITGEQE